MNFKKVLTALTAFAALLFTSCDRNNPDGQIDPVNITVSQDYLEVDSLAGTYHLTLVSNRDWTAEVEVSNPWGNEAEWFEKYPWLVIDRNSGVAGDTVDIAVSVSTNVSDSVVYQREAVIWFRTEEHIYATVTVHQMGGNPKPNADTGAEIISVADFIAEEESEKWYQLSGKLTGLYNTEYGNFYLEDATGSVHVYGLNLHETAGDKTFSQIGLQEGDNVTIIGRRDSYNGEVQVGDAYYAAKKVTVAEFLAAEVDDRQLYELTGTMNDLYNTEYGNFHLIDDAGGDVTVYGLTSTPLTGKDNDKSFSTLGYADGDVLTIVGTRDDYKGTPQVGGPAYAIRAKGGPSLTVVTGEAVLSDDKSSMTVEGTFTYTGEASDITEVGVAYREAGAESFTEEKAPEVVSPFSITVSLEADKAYEYYAYAKMGDEIRQGATLTVSTSGNVLSVSDVVAAADDGTLVEDGSLAVLGAFMEGIVVANNEGENYYRKIQVADGTGAQASGIVLYGVEGDYAVGDRIRLDLSNATYSPFSGLREIAFDDSGARIEVLESGVDFTVPELTAAEFNSGDWQGMYVTVTGLTSDNDEGATWGEDDGTVSRYFVSGDQTVVVRISNYALWAGDVIASGVTGSISGAVEVYNGTLQIYPVTAGDIEDFSAGE